MSEGNATTEIPKTSEEASRRMKDDARSSNSNRRGEGMGSPFTIPTSKDAGRDLGTSPSRRDIRTGEGPFTIPSFKQFLPDLLAGVKVEGSDDQLTPEQKKLLTDKDGELITGEGRAAILQFAANVSKAMQEREASDGVQSPPSEKQPDQK